MQATSKRQEEWRGHNSHKNPPPLRLHVHHHDYQRLKIGPEDSKQWLHIKGHTRHQCDRSRASSTLVWALSTPPLRAPRAPCLTPPPSQGLLPQKVSSIKRLRQHTHNSWTPCTRCTDRYPIDARAASAETIALERLLALVRAHRVPRWNKLWGKSHSLAGGGGEKNFFDTGWDIFFRG